MPKAEFLSPLPPHFGMLLPLGYLSTSPRDPSPSIFPRLDWGRGPAPPVLVNGPFQYTEGQLVKYLPPTPAPPPGKEEQGAVSTALRFGLPCLLHSEVSLQDPPPLKQEA